MSVSSPHRYLVLARRPPSFDASVIEPPRRFLDAWGAAGRIELTEPFTDESGGAYPLRAASLAEATAIVAGDPLALSAASRLSGHEWAAA